MNVQDYIQSGIVESYVLGIANEQEVTELLQLSNQYPEIKQAIESFEAQLETAAFANAVPAPMAIKNNLLNVLQNEFTKPVVSSTVVPITTAPIKSISNYLKYVAAASIILLLCSSVLNFYLYNQYKNANNNYLALLKDNNGVIADNRVYQTKMLDLYNNMQIMSDPNMVKVAMPGVAGKENNLTTVFWNSKTKEVFLLANKLPKAAEGKQYQLWALVDGKPIDAGLLEDCNGLCKLKNTPKVQAFAITLEDKGGSTTPHLDQLVVLGKVG